MKNFRIKKCGDVFYAEKRFLWIFWTSIYEDYVRCSYDSFSAVPRGFCSKEAALDALKNYIKSKKEEKPEFWYYSSDLI